MIVKDELFCSFCGKNQCEVGILIAGPAVYICDKCVDDCRDMIKNKNKKESSEERESVNKKIVKCDVNLKEDSCRICIAEFCIKNRETLLEIITTLANLENDSPEYMFKVKGYTDRLNEESLKEYMVTK